MSDPITQALERAAQQAATQPLPKTVGARMRHLVSALGGGTRGGGTRAAAEALGISRRTVQRYVRDQVRTPRPQIAAALDAELRRHWQPGLQRRALAGAAKNGFTIEARASFGYDAPGGSTDEARMRLITQHIPPQTAAGIVAAYRQGTTGASMRDKVAEALAHHYFQDGGRRAHGLAVSFSHIEYMDIDL
ncbi:telomere-protecting terminal protein Tpg [Streptomyces qinglanensis]|uniref:telomere-protecting terminal protein Tpg n=1 Tax=Streptomyces qinglanensis TaxID=943816 RepID=UPI003D72669E